MSHLNMIDAFVHYFFGDTSREYFQEFKEFWLSLTPEEKRYYRTVDLNTGLPCVEQICLGGGFEGHYNHPGA